MADEEIDVKLFCTRYVEVMGTESDHVHIVALSDALQARALTLSFLTPKSSSLRRVYGPQCKTL